MLLLVLLVMQVAGLTRLAGLYRRAAAGAVGPVGRDARGRAGQEVDVAAAVGRLLQAVLERVDLVAIGIAQRLEFHERFRLG